MTTRYSSRSVSFTPRVASEEGAVSDAPALGCALYFDTDLSANPEPLAGLIRSIFGEASRELTQWTTSEKTQQVGAPAPFKLAALLRRISSGAVASAAVETPPRTLDQDRRLVLAQTTPAAKVRDDVPPRSWRYNLVAALGRASVRELGAARVIDQLLLFAGAVRAKAGVVHWADSASYASGLAMGAGGGLSPAQEARVADSWFWRPHWGRIIRGPAWGTVLSEEHVDRMGGLARIESGCGCFRVAPLSSGGAFLQLTPIDAPIVEDHDEGGQLAALARFLAPVAGAPTLNQ